MLKHLLNCIIFLALLVLFHSSAYATAEYARQTGFACSECHIEAIGAGPLTQKGEKFVEDMKFKGLYKPLSKIQKIVRFIVAYIHLFTAIIWFGTILYVHILLKPAYASKGLPKGELILGWLSIIAISATGILLSVSRVPSWQTLYTTRFGILLSIKIFLFLIMLSTALVVTLYIGPKMRKKRKAVAATDPRDLGVDELLNYDGKEGRPAYIAYNGKIYDVSESRLWKNGSHLQKHSAGHDLTDLLKTAPHGEEKLLTMKEVGILKQTGTPLKKPFYEKLFFFFAYMNLVLVFLIIFVIALMRWGI